MLELGRYYSIDDLVLANKRAGRYFFSPGAMSGFNSRLSSHVAIGADGWYFITSERFIDSRGKADPRTYTVRRMDANAHVFTVENDFSNGASAKRAADRYAQESFTD